MELDYSVSVCESKTDTSSQSYWCVIREHRKLIWSLGLLLRVVVSPWNINSYDYRIFRIPVARGLYEGGTLYNDVPYNHMPLYPYLMLIMVKMVGFQYPILTSLAIKFPQIVADSLIPLIIYKIGISLNKESVGLKASIIYTFNPISIFELNFATFHSISSLFALLSIYSIIQEKPKSAGIFIGLGFLTSQYPLFLLLIVITYWKNDKSKILKASISSLITTSFGIATVLSINGISISTMFSNLIDHPTYNGIGKQCPRPVFVLIHNSFGISIFHLTLLTFFLNGMIILISVIISLTNNRLDLIDLTIINLIVLSIFFYCIHTKYILWLLPFILFWCIDLGKIKILVLSFVIYTFRKLYIDILQKEIKHKILNLYLGVFLADFLWIGYGIIILKEIFFQALRKQN